MKLTDDFFKELECSVSTTGFTTTLELNPHHLVYTGHFPGHPITPGVVHLQIVHELLEKHLTAKLKLKTITQCKFLKVLDPNETSQLVIQIDYTRSNEMVNVKATGKNEADVFFKLHATYMIDSIHTSSA